MSEQPIADAVPPRRTRARIAQAISEDAGWIAALRPPDSDERARDWLANADPRSHVGSRHHTVPALVLRRWATDDQVRVYSRLSGTASVRRVGDLAIKDFYTFVNTRGELESSFESLLGEIESTASRIFANLLSPFTATPSLTIEDRYLLAQFTSFQIVRTTRHRREIELQAEWFAKTIAAGHMSDEALRAVSIVPHQNETLRTSLEAAHELLPFLVHRPLALIILDEPLLLIGDEPVVFNVGSDDDGNHHPDCFLTDAEIEKRIAKEQRKKKRLRRPVGRVVHFRPTVPRGIGVALEVVLPISPRAALWWGLLERAPVNGPIEVERLVGDDAREFARLVNGATAAQALDWVVTTLEDETFRSVEFPPQGPLLSVCDGDSAATSALNDAPRRFRPHRLRPE